MNKKLLFFLAISLFLFGVNAFAAIVRGTITDTEGETLPGATVTLRTLPDSVRVGATVTDFDGNFVITDLKPNRYNILFTMIGLEDRPYNFTVETEADTITFDNVRLAENSVMLKEITVTAVRPAVVAKQDTLEFNAGSYHTNPNATVEDLLKKLPGVEVGTDGSISSGGKSITKILVNGKEFFNDDTQAATKNLTADMIEKVQVIDKKSDLAMLTGVDDGEEETVINLTVKKDMENGWFGTLKGGYGTSSRYEGSLNANLFKDGNQFSIIGGANNINELGFGDMGRARFRDFGGNNGITTSQRLGLNFNVGKDETFRVGGNVFYTHSLRDSQNKGETQYLFPDAVNYQSDRSTTVDRGHNLRADFRMQWKIDADNTLDFRPRFSFSHRDSELDEFSAQSEGEEKTPVNTNKNLQSNSGKNYQFDGDLIYNHNFRSRPGRSFSTQVKYSFSNTLQKGTSWSALEFFLKQEDSEDVMRYLDSHQWSNSVSGRFTWTEPLGAPEKGNFLNIAYNISYSFNNADRFTYTLPPALYPEGTELPAYTEVPDGATEDLDLSNSFRNAFFNQELQIGYKKVSKQLNLEAGLLLSPSMSRSEDLINDARSIPTRWVWNVGPFARIRYKFGTRGSLNVNYRARTTQPTLTQLQPVADVSDPLNIVQGNPNLKPTFTQSVNIRFSNYHVGRQQSVNAMLSASYALNSIVRKTTYNQQTGVRYTEYENANGNLTLMGMFMFNQPLTDRKWRVNARLNGRYSNMPGYIDGDFNRSGNLILSPAAGVTFTSDIFQMTVNPTYTFNMATNSLPRQANRYIHQYGFTADASLYFHFGLEIGSDIAYSYSTGYSKGFTPRQALWNATVSYSVLADRSLTFSARVYDILGQKQNVTRTVSANMISDNEYNDLTRYFMFSVAWKFSTFKKNATGTANAEGVFEDGVPPAGPPPGQGGAERPQGPPPGAGMGFPGGSPRIGRPF